MEAPLPPCHTSGEESAESQKLAGWSSYETVFTNAKAGMEGVDKEKVKKVVYEMSKGSAFFANEQRKDALLQEKLQRLKVQVAQFTTEQLSAYQKVADRHMTELEASRDLSHIWIHVDMDAFFAAVETLDKPSLAATPMGVGSIGMLCTANYEARKYGVRAAMPGFIARKLCPQLVIIKPNFKKYTHYSDLTRQVFRQYDPNFLACSLDEAYLNVTRVCHERNVNPADVAVEIRRKVREVTKLTCSAGIAANRFLAKVCSDINKPDGQYALPMNRDAIMAFVSSLPIRKVGGIGRVNEKLLREGVGVGTCGQLLEKRALLCAVFSKISSDFFMAAGLGIGGSDEPDVEGRKSLSCERTFSALSLPADLVRKLEELADSLAKDMADEGLMGRTLTLKLKSTDFEVRTRAASLPKFIASREEILPAALRLLQAELPISVRLMGLRLSNFKDDGAASANPQQKTLNEFFARPNIGEHCHEEPETYSKQLNTENDLKLAEWGHVSRGRPSEYETGLTTEQTRTESDAQRQTHLCADTRLVVRKPWADSFLESRPYAIAANQKAFTGSLPAHVVRTDGACCGATSLTHSQTASTEQQFSRVADCEGQDRTANCHREGDTGGTLQANEPCRIMQNSEVYELPVHFSERSLGGECAEHGDASVEKQSSMEGISLAGTHMKAQAPLVRRPARGEKGKGLFPVRNNWQLSSNTGEQAENFTGKAQWTRVAPECFCCSLCGLRCKGAAMLEHEDFHLAQMLQEEEDIQSRSQHAGMQGEGHGAAWRRSHPTQQRDKRGRGVAESSHRKRSKLLTIDSFLRGNSSPSIP